MAIVGNFARNRNRRIREIYDQTADFVDGIAAERPSIQTTNRLTFVDWLPSWAIGHQALGVQVIRARALRAGGPQIPHLESGESTISIPRQ